MGWVSSDAGWDASSAAGAARESTSVFDVESIPSVPLPATALPHVQLLPDQEIRPMNHVRHATLRRCGPERSERPPPPGPLQRPCRQLLGIGSRQPQLLIDSAAAADPHHLVVEVLGQVDAASSNQ